ncbi:MAG: peptide deformylase [Fimbriiglobus sp.]
MTPLKIVNYPHPALRAKAKPVAALDNDVIAAANGMLELMYRHEGLGLAAQQVALDFQVLVINFKGKPDQKDQEVVAINPVIVDAKGAVKDREGCLSFPNLFQDIRRMKTVTVRYYDLAGKQIEMVCSDLPARIWQHEIDHLNGVLFIDKMGPFARLGSRKDIEDLIADFEAARKKGTIPPGTEMKL